MKRYDIENIEPKEVNYWFKKICEIPHGSYHEEALSKWLAKTCKELGCHEVKVYPSGMILAKQKATPGCEGKNTVLLQSHMDMVLAKTADCEKDLTKEPITAYYDSEKDWLTAEKTTLGADNGAGVAEMLAIMENKNGDIVHGPIEYIFSTNEEDKCGECYKLDNFKAEDSDATYYLNLDGTATDAIIYGSAGCITACYDNEVNFIKKDMQFPTFRISLSGFKGGHSGTQIHLPHINAIVFLAETLLSFAKTYKTTVCLSHLHGGPINNAIPLFAHADVNIEEKHAKDLVSWFQKALILAKKVAQGEDDGVKVEITRAEKQATECLGVHDTIRTLVAIACCPNKVFTAKKDNTCMFSSSNLGLADLDSRTKRFKADFKIRGFIDDDVTRTLLKINYYMDNFNWPNYTVQGLCRSFLNDVNTNAAAQTWIKAYIKIRGGKEPRPILCAGGLEITELCLRKPEVTPNTICVAATVFNEHSPLEALPIHDLKIFWAVLKEFLKTVL